MPKVLCPWTLIPIPSIGQASCKNCRFYAAKNTASGHDKCRRHAPAQDDATKYPLFPHTTKDGWCGDHEPNREYAMKRIMEHLGVKAV